VMADQLGVQPPSTVRIDAGEMGATSMRNAILRVERMMRDAKVTQIYEAPTVAAVRTLLSPKA
jgi:hypothetical protein